MAALWETAISLISYYIIIFGGRELMKRSAAYETETAYSRSITFT